MNNKPTTPEIIILASGAGALIFSFLPWLEGFGEDASAWNGDVPLLFPTYTFVAILGVVMAGAIALERFAGTQLPQRVLGFTWPQIHLSLAIYTALLVVGFLVAEKFGADMGIGYFLSLLAAAGLVVGAVMLQKEREATGGRPAPSPGGGPGAPPPPQQPPPQQPPPQQPPPPPQ